MVKHIEDFSISELATLANEIIPEYKLSIKGEPVVIEDEIMGMYEAADEISDFYRKRILECLYTISDMINYQQDTAGEYPPEDEDDGYTPMGFDYKNKQK